MGKDAVLAALFAGGGGGFEFFFYRGLVSGVGGCEAENLSVGVGGEEKD